MAETRTRTAAAVNIDFERLLVLAAALATAAAGIGHLSAARDHPAHAHITAFFTFLALAQLGWAAAVAFRPSLRLLRIGLAGNAAVVAVWAVSRTTGIPFISGADQGEAVAVKDAVTTLLEVLALGATGLALVLPDDARRLRVPSGERAVAVMVSAALLLALPAALGSNGHGDNHGEHGDDDHALVAGQVALAAGGGHEHGDGGTQTESAGQLLEHHVEEVAMPGPATGHAHGSAGTDAGAGGQAGLSGAGHEGHGDDAGSAGPAGSASASPPVGEVSSARYGPFALPPGSTNDARGSAAVVSNTVLTQLPPPCRNCYLTAVDIDLVYADGRSANFDTGAMLHHHVMFNSGEDDPTCGRWEGDSGIGFLGRRIFAAGNERTPGVFPAGYGYHVGGFDWWSGIFEIMNMIDTPQTVFVDVTVRYLPDSDDVKPLEPIWLDVDNCGDSQFDVPAGRTVTPWDWVSNTTGRIVFAGGHVHDGGVSITMSNRTTGEHMCRSVAGYGTKPAYEGHIESMSSCSWDRVGRVRSGETLGIDTVYDTSEPLSGVMGILMFWLYETDDVDGGTPPPPSVTSPPEGGAPPPASHDH